MHTHRFLALLSLTFALAATGGALSGQAAGCDPVYAEGHPRAFHISRFTNYEPARGGLNGRCGQSSTRGIDACRFYLEDHLQGNRQAAVVAVPQRGPASHLFGGVYRLNALEQRGMKPTTSCTLGIAADHYGSSSNYKNKMDIVTRPHSRLARAVNSTHGSVVLVGTVNEFRSANGTRRIRHSRRSY